MTSRTTLVAFVAALLLVAACRSDDTTSTDNAGVEADVSAEVSAEAGTTAEVEAETGGAVEVKAEVGSTAEVEVEANSDPALFDAASVHEIELTFDQADYDSMIETLSESGDKTWIDVTVTIDGVTYEHAGARLKGNSSLAGLMGGFGVPGSDLLSSEDRELLDLCFYYDIRHGEQGAVHLGAVNLGSQPSDDDDGPSDDNDAVGGYVEGFGPGGLGDQASADEPEKLPWLIRLDRFVEGQQHQEYVDIVIRSNFSETSLNEALALDLLKRVGLVSQEAAHVRFTVNGSESELRLMIEHPSDDAWQDRNFSSAGALYKAESTGNWSYRGDKPADYVDVFDQEGGRKVADLTPLIEFLEFINEADDSTFAAELPERLDVESFATYLAMMELVQNWDDIDGPGNNAYLWWDAESAQFTVVPWDMNLTFDGMFGDFEVPYGFEGELPEDFQPPEDAVLPEDFELPEDLELPEDFDSSECGFGGPNPLVERFHANTEFESLYQDKLAELTAELIDSQSANEVLATRVAVLKAQATDLVSADTIEQEADAITELLSMSTR